jgi:hypothetical protein
LAKVIDLLPDRCVLLRWPEQRNYVLIRPSVLFGSPASERTLQRRVVRFGAEVMERPYGSEAAKRRGLTPSVRRLVVDLKAVEAVRRLQRNPNLDAFRVHAALAQAQAVRQVARAAVPFRAWFRAKP